MQKQFSPIILSIFLFSSIFSGNLFAGDTLELENFFLVVHKSQAQQAQAALYSIRKDGAPLTFDQLKNMRGESLKVEKVDLNIEVEHDIMELRSSFFPGGEEFSFDGKSLSYSLPVLDRETRAAKETRVTPIASTNGKLAISNLMVNQNAADYIVYNLSFHKYLTLEAQAHISDSKIKVNYQIDITTLHEETIKLKRLNILRANLRKNQGSRPVDISKLKRESPALEESIQRFIEPIKLALTSELGENNSGQVEKNLKALEAKLYRISAKVDALNLLSFDDPNLNSYSSSNLKGKELKRLRQEHAMIRTSDLVDLFYILTQEMEAAKNEHNISKAKSIAAESLRVIAEIYLIAGKTNGSINRKKTYNAVASVASAIMLAVSAGQVEPATLKISLFAAAAVFMGNFATELWSRDMRYVKSRFPFPGISAWDKKRSSRAITGRNLNQDLYYGVPSEQIFSSAPSNWAAYVKGNRKLDNAKVMLNIIKMASGQELSKALSLQACELLVAGDA